MWRITLTTVCVGLILALQSSQTDAAGNFYVGLLGYNNTEGLLCCGNQTDESTCMANCSLIFEVRVSGLNGSIEAKNLSTSELSLATSITIPSSMVTNPLSFQFTEWPGTVNVTVVVRATYKEDVYRLFDKFEHTFNGTYPTDFYFSSVVDSDFLNDRSRLTIVFRYRCIGLKGHACFADCLEHNDTEPCPPTVAMPTNVYTWSYSCEEFGNCTVNTTTRPSVIVTTLPRRGEVSTESGVDNSMSIATTSKVYQDSGSSRNSSTASPVNRVTSELNDTLTTIDLGPSTPTTVTEQVTSDIDNNGLSETDTTTTKTNNISTNGVTADRLRRSTTTITPSTASRATSTRSVIDTGLMSTTPEEISTKIADDPVYWPAIVGGVLGGIAFFSALGFFIYYRRQKKMRKRQEIYNVNPKVLRNFEEYEENGTSGRADVPLETEQY